MALSGTIVGKTILLWPMFKMSSSSELERRPSQEDCSMTKRIGELHAFALENLHLFGITPLRSILSPDLFLEAQDRPVGPATILIPEIVFWLMALVALTRQSMAGAITRFWSTCGILWALPGAHPVTEEAFCLARKKLPGRFFQKAFAAVLQRYQARFPDRYRWKGLRLLGIDGMKLTLPASARLHRFFPPASNQLGPCRRPQGLLVGLVGLFDGLCYDFKLVSSKGSEQKCARRMIGRSLGRGDLLLCDKNFPDYQTLALLTNRRADYLFRLQWKRFDHYRPIPIPGGTPDEWYILLDLPERLRRKHPELPGQISARVLRYQTPGFRPSLLITSLLDPETYDYASLVSLYHERWRQETQHREWKYTLSMSELRSHTIRGIFKEVYVQLTVNNVLRWLMSESCQQTPWRPVDLKYLECKRLLLSYSHMMAGASVQQLPLIYKRLVDEIGLQQINVRPGRRYPRKHDNEIRCKGDGQFVLPARILPQETRPQ